MPDLNTRLNDLEYRCKKRTRTENKKEEHTYTDKALKCLIRGVLSDVKCFKDPERNWEEFLQRSDERTGSLYKGRVKGDAYFIEDAKAFYEAYGLFARLSFSRVQLPWNFYKNPNRCLRFLRLFIKIIKQDQQESGREEPEVSQAVLEAHSQSSLVSTSQHQSPSHNPAISEVGEPLDDHSRLGSVSHPNITPIPAQQPLDNIGPCSGLKRYGQYQEGCPSGKRPCGLGLSIDNNTHDDQGLPYVRGAPTPYFLFSEAHFDRGIHSAPRSSNTATSTLAGVLCSRFMQPTCTGPNPSPLEFLEYRKSASSDDLEILYKWSGRDALASLKGRSHENFRNEFYWYMNMDIDMLPYKEITDNIRRTHLWKHEARFGAGTACLRLMLPCYGNSWVYLLCVVPSSEAFS